MASDPHASSEPPETAVPAPEADEASSTQPEGPPAVHKLKFTRAGALWTALFAGFVTLIVLLIFIAQNTESAEFHFLGWQWSLPLGVAILGAAVCGGLLAVAAGTARILQLRREAKRGYKS